MTLPRWTLDVFLGKRQESKRLDLGQEPADTHHAQAHFIPSHTLFFILLTELNNWTKH